MDARGKFIVIEGTEGSGKAIQFERLVLALPEGAKVGTLEFPQYDEPSSYFIKRYLTGKYGGEAGPYAVSVFYAADRFDSKLKILQWLSEGRTVVANHYVASTMSSQGARFDTKDERERFYEWVYSVEYGAFGIPKPDVNILLHGPTAGNQIYQEIAAHFPGDFAVVECMEHGTLLAPDKIHEKVLGIVLKALAG